MSTASATNLQPTRDILTERRPILSAMFAPKSVALIGASEKPGSVGRALTENIQSFKGRVFLVNPSHPTILGQKTFSQISNLPEAIDLAVKHNKRSWKYCEAILKRWKEEGRAEKQSGRDDQASLQHDVEDKIKRFVDGTGA